MKIGLQSWWCIVRIGGRAGTAILALAAVLVVGAATARAQTYSVLYSFQCGTNDGDYPFGGLVRNSVGNLYGTTIYGGTLNYGTVFKVTPSGTETVLHSFAGNPDGTEPSGSLILDGADNIYGTADGGGSSGVGVVFKLTPSGAETVLYTFGGSFDGGNPVGGLVRDSMGNLYGTTSGYGGYNYGVVFKLTPGGHETVLHDFDDVPTDGAAPQDGLIRDAAGNLYGTTTAGGPSNAGTVFKVTPTGMETVLYNFAGPPMDGWDPFGGTLLRDQAGNLYGAVARGGPYNGGILFKLTPTGVETRLLNFNTGETGYLKGFFPFDGLVEDGTGNFYGTANEGGSLFDGVLFKLTPSGQEFVLHTFGGSDGAYPNGGLIRDSAGNIYGTTGLGGAFGCGTVFKMARN